MVGIAADSVKHQGKVNTLVYDRAMDPTRATTSKASAEQIGLRLMVARLPSYRARYGRSRRALFMNFHVSTRLLKHCICYALGWAAENAGSRNVGCLGLSVI